MEARVAVLEQIARTTEAALGEIKADLRAFRAEAAARFDKADARTDKLDDRMRAEARWLLVTMAGMFAALAGIMAKGFHWL